MGCFSSVSKHREEGIAKLKLAQDKINQYKASLDTAIANFRASAIEHIKSKQEEQAKLALKKKEYLESKLEIFSNCLEQVESHMSFMKEADSDHGISIGIMQMNEFMRNVDSQLPMMEVNEYMKEAEDFMEIGMVFGLSTVTEEYNSLLKQTGGSEHKEEPISSSPNEGNHKKKKHRKKRKLNLEEDLAESRA